ncbi:hypothetical protein F5Y19DRAFT_471799 [Xylariaceae sp. FL1651]|nr:hypothetical protein F5Y19DRAFT_471799 [Xylariaceae sp. FL1651]
MAVNIAFTSAVNKPGEEVVLTADDVWEGIVMTVRQPQDFVDYISKVDILEDTGLHMRRVLHFVPAASHSAPGGKLDQNVTFVPNYKVEFVAAATGKSVMSVSKDVDSEDGHELQVYLTQAFEIPYPPGVEPDSEKALEMNKHFVNVARSNIRSNLQSFRNLKAKKQAA